MKGFENSTIKWLQLIFVVASVLVLSYDVAKWVTQEHPILLLHEKAEHAR